MGLYATNNEQNYLITVQVGTYVPLDCCLFGAFGLGALLPSFGSLGCLLVAEEGANRGLGSLDFLDGKLEFVPHQINIFSFFPSSLPSHSPKPPSPMLHRRRGIIAGLLLLRQIIPCPLRWTINASMK